MYEYRSVFIVQDSEDGHIAQVYGSERDAQRFIDAVRAQGPEGEKLVINEWRVEFYVEEAR